jgi:hypothetical protein
MLYGVEEAFRFMKEWLRNDATNKRKKPKGRKQKYKKAQKRG